MKRAIVLLSGGLDSAVSFYLARKQGFDCFCLIFDYGQRHKKEIECAKKLAKQARCQFKIIKLDLASGACALLNKKINFAQGAKGIPNTYVPARNIIFLSIALSYSEALKAEAIFIGVHAHDYSGYPDCRPEFYQAFNKVIKVGTKSGVENKKIKVVTPLINKNKSQIIKLGVDLGVPFGLTWSCYRGGSKPCGKCDSCYYRAKGFRQAGLQDP